MSVDRDPQAGAPFRFDYESPVLRFGADPVLAATTPESVLAGSAMNGFDRGLETLYAANATPVTDATATRGVGLLAGGLRDLGE